MTAVLSGAVTLAACVHFDALPLLDAQGGSDAPADLAPDSGAYHATAVRFESASGDYITQGNLANTTNAPRGTFSVWLHLNAGDGKMQMISVAQVVAIGGVIRNSNNHIQFALPNCAGNVLLDMQTQNVYTSSSGWIHVLASWDVSAGRVHLFINDVEDLEVNPMINDGNICYSSLKWGIGGLSSGQLDADVADFYAALGTYVDLSVDANRRSFSTAAGKPVDLGLNCNTPTGVTPTGCFDGPVGTWFANKGVGLGFTVEGDGLALAPTSPSD